MRDFMVNTKGDILVLLETDNGYQCVKVYNRCSMTAAKEYAETLGQSVPNDVFIARVVKSKFGDH